MNTTWIWIIVVAAVIGAAIGFFSGKGDGEDAAQGAMAGGCMAASCLLRLFLAGLSIMLVIWLFSAIFG